MRSMLDSIIRISISAAIVVSLLMGASQAWADEFVPTIDIIGGTGQFGFSGPYVPVEDLPCVATDTRLWNTQSEMVVDSKGNVYYAYWDPFYIRSYIFKIDTDGNLNLITALTKNSPDTEDYDGDNLADSWFWGIDDLAVDSHDNLYIIMWGYLLKVDAETGIISNIGGVYHYTRMSVDLVAENIPATEALVCPNQYYNPVSIYVDDEDNIYLSYGQWGCVRKIDAATGLISTVAGPKPSSLYPRMDSWDYGGDGGPATEALMWLPSDMTKDDEGNLYICDTNNKRIRKVDTNGIITTYAGNGAPLPYGTDIVGKRASQVKTYYGRLTWLNGEMFFSDSNRFYKIDRNGIIRLLAGGGTSPVIQLVDGTPALDVGFLVEDSYVDKSGTLYISDGMRHSIVKIVLTPLPTCPVNLTVSDAQADSVSLMWDAPETGQVTGYKIFRDGIQVDDVMGAITYYDDASVENCTEYSYTVVAYNAYGESPDCASVTAATLDNTPPDCPAMGGDQYITNRTGLTLEWDAATDNCDAAGLTYNVYDNDVAIGATSVLYFTAAVNDECTEHVFTVTATDSSGNESGSCGSTTVYNDFTAPDCPDGLAMTEGGDSVVTLTWNPSADSCDGTATGYKVYVVTEVTQTPIGTTDGTSFSYNAADITGVSNFSLMVTAFDSMGNESTGCDTKLCVTVLDTDGAFDSPIGNGNADNINRNSIPVKFTTYYEGSAYFGIASPILYAYSKDADGNYVLLASAAFEGSGDHWQYNLKGIDDLLAAAGAALNSDGKYEVTLMALPDTSGAGCVPVFRPVPVNILLLDATGNGNNGKGNNK